MNIIYCTTVLPSRKRTGGEIATQSFVDALRQAGHRVRVLGYRRPGDKSPIALDEVIVGERPIETEHAGLHAYAWLLSALFRGSPYSVEKYVSPAYGSCLMAELQAFSPCVVVLDHAQMGFLLDHLPGEQAFVYVAHNVEANIYRAQIDGASSRAKRWLMAREARLIDRLEAALVKRASQTWVLTEHDRAHFAALADGEHVVCCAIPATALVSGEVIQSLSKWDLGLIGTWTWDANAAGLRWFQHEVVKRFPHKWDVAVAGKGAEAIVAEPVQPLGFVPDAIEFLLSCKVICIPSTSGGGVQVKTLDAIATGRPIVATSVAMRGIESPPSSVRVADSADEFVRAILEVLPVHSDEISEEARDWSHQRRDEFERLISRCMQDLEIS